MKRTEHPRLRIERRCALVAAAIAIASASPAGLAHADDRDAARQAYDRGLAAFRRGAYRESALACAEADRLSPNPVALVAALRAVALTDDPALAMQLVERAEARSGSKELDDAARTVRDKFQGRAGRLVARCADEAPCTMRIDAADALTPGEARWITSGDHAIEVRSGDATQSYSVHIAGGERLDWHPPARARPAVVMPEASSAPATPGAGAAPSAPPAANAEPASTRSASARTWSPAWVVVGAGATVALAGFTTWSGIDTLNKYDAFRGGDDSAESSGRAAQLRTNVLLGVTGAAAIGTALVGVFLVDWKKHRASSTTGARLVAGPGGVGFVVRR